VQVRWSDHWAAAIAIDVSASCDRKEIEALTLQSYRHFALKRTRVLLKAPG
jgi:hypothetical protein